MFLKYLLTITFVLSSNIVAQVTESYCNYENIDKKLNEVYNKILKEYCNDTIFISRFRNAQRAWILFRDNHIESRFPSKNEDDKKQKYGSVYSVCKCLELSEITNDRINQLEKWLDGANEGDVCNGSYKMK